MCVFIFNNVHVLAVFYVQPGDVEDDDVELSNFMDVEDDMDGKSTASWNPKFDFEVGGGTSTDLSKLGEWAFLSVCKCTDTQLVFAYYSVMESVLR